MVMLLLRMLLTLSISERKMPKRCRRLSENPARRGEAGCPRPSSAAHALRHEAPVTETPSARLCCAPSLCFGIKKQNIYVFVRIVKYWNVQKAKNASFPPSSLPTQSDKGLESCVLITPMFKIDKMIPLCQCQGNYSSHLVPGYLFMWTSCFILVTALFI